MRDLSWAAAAAVTTGAMLGGASRYLADWWWQRRPGSRAGDSPADPSPFPWATLGVNVIGSLLLGLMVGAGWQGWRRDLVGVGFCGALTTYSTFSFELLRHVEQGCYRRAVTYASACLVVGLGAAGLGVMVARAWS